MRFTRRTRIVVWSLLAIYWTVLFTATHVPPRDLPKTHVSDKIEHMTAYGILSCALFLSLWPTRRSNFRIILMVVGIVLLYAAVDELTQPLTGRSCDLYDWFADATGTAFAVILMTTARTLASRPQQAEPA